MLVNGPDLGPSNAGRCVSTDGNGAAANTGDSMRCGCGADAAGEGG